MFFFHFRDCRFCFVSLLILTRNAFFWFDTRYIYTNFGMRVRIFFGKRRANARALLALLAGACHKTIRGQCFNGRLGFWIISWKGVRVATFYLCARRSRLTALQWQYSVAVFSNTRSRHCTDLVVGSVFNFSISMATGFYTKTKSDFVFILDVFLQFRTSYVDSNGRTESRWRKIGVRCCLPPSFYGQ